MFAPPQTQHAATHKRNARCLQLALVVNAGPSGSAPHDGTDEVPFQKLDESGSASGSAWLTRGVGDTTDAVRGDASDPQALFVGLSVLLWHFGGVV